jgi:predicted DNA-binding WGR domain protein/DNA-binding beta-propeller fold protein YncE
MPRFEFEEGSSQKFWEISLTGAALTTSWGKLGTAGQQKTQTMGDAAAARKEHDKLIASKLKKGYRAVSDAGAKPQTAAPAAKGAAAEKAPPAVKAIKAGGEVAPASAQYTEAHRVKLLTSPVGLAASADGRWVASANSDQKLRIYEAATMQEVKELHLGTAFPYSVFFSADSRWVFAGGKSVQSFEAETWKKGPALKGHSHDTHRAVLSSDGGAWTASGENFSPHDWSLRNWDLATGKQLLRFKLEHPLYGLDVSPDGQRLVCGDGDGNVTLVNATTGKSIWTTKALNWAYVTLFSADGTEVFAGGQIEDDDGQLLSELRVLDAATGEKRRTIAVGPWVRDLQRLANGMLLAGVNKLGKREGSLQVVNPTTGKLVWSSEPLGQFVGAVAASADGRTLYAHSADMHAVWVFSL